MYSLVWSWLFIKDITAKKRWVWVKITVLSVMKDPKGTWLEAYKTTVFLPRKESIFVHFIPLHQGTTVNSLSIFKKFSEAMEKLEKRKCLAGHPYLTCWAWHHRRPTKPAHTSHGDAFWKRKLDEPWVWPSMTILMLLLLMMTYCHVVRVWTLFLKWVKKMKDVTIAFPYTKAWKMWLF